MARRGDGIYQRGRTWWLGPMIAIIYARKSTR